MSANRPGRVSPARRAAFTVLLETFDGGRFTDHAFREQAADLGLEGRERAQAQRLAYGSVQRRGTSDAILTRLSRRRPAGLDPAVLAALRLGLYELFFADGTPDHAAVDEAVELTRGGGSPRAAGLVNAVLRRATRERRRLTEWIGADEDPATAAIAHSVPRWLAELWWQQLGAEPAQSMLAACNRPAERALRVNTARWDVEQARAAALELGAELAPAPAGPGPEAPEIVVVESGWAKLGSWIEQGLATPQSRGSAMAVQLLDPRPGETVLDLCAGPGTKTGQIAARMQGRGELIAVEPDPDRAEQTAAQMRRLGVHMASVVELDGSSAEFGGPGFDRVLVDAPCSDLGALNSRPDARWRKSPALIERVADLQRQILATAATQLGPGGTLVYATCTVSEAENEAQVAALPETVAGGGELKLRVDDLGSIWPGLASGRDSRFLQIRPDRDRTTGFFLARFRRTPSGAG